MSGIIGHTMYAILAAKAAAHRTFAEAAAVATRRWSTLVCHHGEMATTVLNFAPPGMTRLAHLSVLRKNSSAGVKAYACPPGAIVKSGVEPPA